MPFITKLGAVAARAYGWLASVAQAVVSSDTYFYLVSMLLPGNGTNGAQNNTFLDSSTNNFTITRNGNTTQGTFSPFSQTGWSNYFDGTGDYLVPPNSTDWVLPGSFTVEFWFYATSTPTIGGIFSTRNSVSATYGLDCALVASDNKIWVDIANSSATNLTLKSISTIVLNQWQHVAIVGVNGTSLAFYLNGVLQASGSISTTPAYSSIVLGRYYTDLNNYYFQGYLSNFRIVKGTALYTSTFVPSYAPLSVVPGTSLLTCQSNRFVDNSANNFTITRNGDVTVTANSPFTPNNQTTTSYSGWFDGTGDYLTVPDNAAFELGSGNFTIEALVNFAVLPPSNGNQATIVSKWATSNASYELYLYNNAGAYLIYLTYSTNGSAATNLGVSWTPSAGTWYHVACVRSSTNLIFYINGVQQGATQTLSGTLFDGTAVLEIGGYLNGSAGSVLNGLISNLRIVKGTAVYTANFTPPTTPLTAISGTSLLTCQNATFIDNSTNAFAITVYGNTQPVTTNPFQTLSPNPITYSGYFDGTGDYLNGPNNAAFSYSGDFTIECWIYPTSVAAATQGIYSQIDNSADTWTGVRIALTTSSFVGVGYNTIGDQLFSIAHQTAVAPGVWSHVAMTRSGSTIRVFLNGVVGTTTYTSSQTFGQSGTTVGSLYPGTSAFTGFISNLRVVNGTAVYTANFIPPAAPLTAISGTSLLTCQDNRFVDNSSNAFAITVNGNTTPSLTNPYGYSTPTSSTAYSGFFDGSGDYLSTTYGGGIASSQAFTFEFWIYPVGNIATNAGIDTTQVVSGFILYGGSTANTLVISRNSVGAIFTSTITITPNTWNHVAISRNTSGSLRMWINGANAGVITDSGAFASGPTKYIGSQGASNYFTGFLSNYRWVVGTAVYDPTQTTITVPTAPLTAISGTSLLTCQNFGRFIDNSTNAFTITVNGNTTPSVVNPFGYSAPTAPTSVSYSALTNGASGYFDGSGDYLSVPSNSNLTFGTGDFTIESWIYISSNSSDSIIIGNGPWAANKWALQTNHSTQLNKLSLWVYNINSVAATVASATTLATKTWYHIAVTRSGSTFRLFLNGTQAATTSSTSLDGAVASNLYVGSDSLTASTFFNGYISSLRIINGTALYTSNFTPPLLPFTAVTNTSLLLNYTNAGIYDAASQNDLETVGNAQISTTQSKWGGSSMAFDGTGDYLTAPDNPAWFFGTGNFTIEFWVYFSSIASLSMLVQQGANVNNRWVLYYSTTTGMSFDVASAAIGIISCQQGSTAGWAINTWYHVALVRNGSAFNIYRNGTSIASATDADSIPDFAGALYIGGGAFSGDISLNGYIDDLRITKYARYTANFTPPTAAFPTQ